MSPVWEYFEKLENGKSMCKVCKKEPADGGGTSNLKNHLRMKPVEEAKKCFN